MSGLWVALATFAMATAPSAPVPAEGSLDAVRFLVGRWESRADGARTVEVWEAPEAGVMFGRSSTIRDGRTVFFEHLVLLAHPGGGVVYRAQPVGQAATSFEVVGHGEGWVVFANPAHDYPRRIRYERSRAGLVATIDDGEGGDARVWTMRRAR